MTTKGHWIEMWDLFDKRQKAKARRPAANEDAGDEGGDAFARAGVVAE